MKATIEIDLELFNTPNFVLAGPSKNRPDGRTEKVSYPLSDIDANALDWLCQEFRDAVFRKSGKSPPPIVMPACPNCRNTPKPLQNEATD